MVQIQTAEATEHPRLLRKRQQWALAPRAHHTEISRVLGPFMVGHIVNDAVESRVGDAQPQGLLAASADAEAYIEFVAYAGVIEFSENLDRILQVAVHDSNIFSFSIRQSD